MRTHFATSVTDTSPYKQPSAPNFKGAERGFDPLFFIMFCTSDFTPTEAPTVPSWLSRKLSSGYH